MGEEVYIQWFPGHMTKTRRAIEADVSKVDCVIELLDARCPKSSQNPDLPAIVGGKPVLTVLNKCDMSEEAENGKWRKKLGALCVSSRTGAGMDRIAGALKTLLRDKIERDAARGIVGRTVRVMVCGIPNVGKSSFINRLAGKSAARVGDRPGVTRGKQWVSISDGMELLDTAGILWPKLDDRGAALNLAFTGAVKDEVMDTEALARALLERLAREHPQNLCERYKITLLGDEDGAALLEKISRRRGFILKGNETDTLRGANIVLDEFRAVKIGRITLDKTEEL